MKIVGSIIGRKNEKITEESIYDCMLDINEKKERITIEKISNLMSCSLSTINRVISDKLKEEKRILNNNL